MTMGLAVTLIIVAAIAGYVFGLIDGRVTSSLRNNAKKKANPAESLSDLPLGKFNLPGEKTILEVTQDQASKIHVALDGQRLQDASNLGPELRRRMVEIVVRIRPWLEGNTVRSSAAPDPAENSPSQPGGQTLPAGANQARAAATSTGVAKPNSTRELKPLIAFDSKAAIEQNSTSLVSMIDEILQKKLETSPLQGRGIKLLNAPNGEVIVAVGSQNYNGVDSVPDPEIRDLIKSAIHDWENR